MRDFGFTSALFVSLMFAFEDFVACVWLGIFLSIKAVKASERGAARLAH